MSLHICGKKMQEDKPESERPVIYTGQVGRQWKEGGNGNRVAEMRKE